MAPTCTNCGGTEFVWADELKTGGTLARGPLSIRVGGELPLGTRICRACGHADLFLRNVQILQTPHHWKPGEFTPISGGGRAAHKSHEPTTHASSHSAAASPAPAAPMPPMPAPPPVPEPPIPPVVDPTPPPPPPIPNEVDPMVTPTTTPIAEEVPAPGPDPSPSVEANAPEASSSEKNDLAGAQSPRKRSTGRRRAARTKRESGED